MVWSWFRGKPSFTAPRTARRRFRPRFETLEGRELPATFVVTTAADSGTGSLRQAITDANNTGGSSTIDFHLPRSALTIAVTSPLPALVHPVLIDGTSQVLYNGKPVVTLNGAGAGAGADGLTLTGGNSTVTGLVIQGFDGSGIVLRGDGNAVLYNYIGTDRAVTHAVPNRVGVNIQNGSSNNIIGSMAALTENDIAGNLEDGIRIAGSNNQVMRNHIGTNVSGTAAIPNGNGVDIVSGSNNQIGTLTTDSGNLISGNGQDGVLIASGGNAIRGDLIGTNSDGTQALGNQWGIVIAAGGGNTIGNTTGFGNLISGNYQDGVVIQTSNNTVLGNYIGTNAAGDKALGNQRGIFVAAGTANAIGSVTNGNLISGNGQDGLVIESDGNTVQGNFIGSNVQGNQALGNQRGIVIDGSNNVVGGYLISNLIAGNRDDGVLVTGNGNSVFDNSIGTSGFVAIPNYNGVYVTGSFNQIGGTAGGWENIISASVNYGVYLAGTGNVVQGNGIGVVDDGSAPLPNAYGIYVEGGSNNQIGGSTPGLGNLVSGNTVAGIYLHHSSNNVVQGNGVGPDKTGAGAFSNYDGIVIDGGTGNTVGGAPAGGNVISGNSDVGLYVASDGNLVEGNTIGTDVTGQKPLGNGYGILLLGSNNTIGGNLLAGATNVISGNTNDGLYVVGNGNVIQGNAIGTDATATFAVPNLSGISVLGSDNLIGGPLLADGNIISGNRAAGINLRGDGNQVQNNFIGTSDVDSPPIGNAVGVYVTGNNNLIGGSTATLGNTIAYNTTDGVQVDGGTRNTIRANAIFGHANGLGIRLVNGGNGNEAFPVLTSAVFNGRITIAGSLTNTPNTTFTLEFFGSPVPNTSGYGEGQQYIGSATVTTNGLGVATFSFDYLVYVPVGEYVSATTTGPEGNTSQFALSILVTGTGAPDQGSGLGRKELDASAVLGGDSVSVRSVRAGSPPATDVGFGPANGATVPAAPRALPRASQDSAGLAWDDSSL